INPRAGPFHYTMLEQKSCVSDASHGDRHRLVSVRLTMESFPAFAEVVIGSGARIVVGCRPVKSMRFQALVFSIGVISTQNGIKAGRASLHESRECRFTFVGGIVADAAILFCHTPPFIIGR